MSEISTTADKTPIGTYSVENGATVSIAKGGALDYSLMRASQLCSLLHVIQAPGFSDCSDTIKADCTWLATCLSEEVKQLFKLVDADARQESRAQMVEPAQ